MVYANAITRTVHDDKTGEDIEHEIPYMKGYTVFNVEQIEGPPEIYYSNAVPTLDPIGRNEHMEKFFASVGATIRHGGNRAYYAQDGARRALYVVETTFSSKFESFISTSTRMAVSRTVRT